MNILKDFPTIGWSAGAILCGAFGYVIDPDAHAGLVVMVLVVSSGAVLGLLIGIAAKK